MTSFLFSPEHMFCRPLSQPLIASLMPRVNQIGCLSPLTRLVNKHRCRKSEKLRCREGLRCHQRSRKLWCFSQSYNDSCWYECSNQTVFLLQALCDFKDCGPSQPHWENINKSTSSISEDIKWTLSFQLELYAALRTINLDPKELLVKKKKKTPSCLEKRNWGECSMKGILQPPPSVNTLITFNEFSTYSSLKPHPPHIWGTTPACLSSGLVRRQLEKLHTTARTQTLMASVRGSEDLC